MKFTPSELKKLRKELRKTLTDVGTAVGLAPATVWYTENEMRELGAKKYARLEAYFQTELDRKEAPLQ